MYPIILLTQEEMKARCDKDLCYNCDEVYSFEHRCAKIQFYMLKIEEEGDKEEVENTEIVFDSRGKFREVPDPEPTPIKANSGSDLVSPMLNLPELEGVKPELETRPFVKEINPPDSTIVTGLSQLQEVPVEASIDAKETKSGPKPIPNPNPYTPLIKPPNQNLLTLSYPNPNFPPIQTQSFQAIIQDTAAYLVAIRPNPWPNKLPKHTNTNRLKPWPNKLPKLTNIIRPKPWPDEPPIYTVPKPRNRSKEMKEIREVRTQSTMVLNRYLQQVKEGKAYQFQLLVESKPDDQLQTSPMANKVRILDFSVTNHARKGIHYRFWSTLSRAAIIDPLDSDESQKIRGDSGMTLTDEAAIVASMLLQLEEMKIMGGDRLRWRPGRLPTPFLGVVRLRSRLERQLLDSPEANCVLNRFRNRVLAMAQLRNPVIAILRYLPEFDPGDQ